MMKFKNIIVVLAVVLAVSSCKDNAEPEVKTVDIEVTNKEVAKTLDPNATYAKVEFGIEGMTCAVGCAKTIEKKMAKMDGVKSAKVDFDNRLAMVEFDEAKVTPKSLEEAVAKVGDVYKVKDMKLVDSFGGEAKKCKEDCNKACCANKTEAEKKACKADCKMPCCNKEDDKITE
ncbi:heavy-metal-associated domain-containing protein [Winogradskyella aquimaris]|uniref:Heavy metal-associated domain-containing protein n=1 Tax=Winogradskyella aquimaris TaxID=864074 RepID=A0ABU5EIH3_9FLAO|nr:heavy metal-associated domain-containing protein [Winogradskyella aquimaris]MDY2586089.1 heavy metal-associated domain-containing protein [Winogradskyella aquimaris]